MAKAQRTYLVTGAAGFIGSRFVESCNLRGIDLISVDRLPLFSERPEHRNLNFGRKVDLDLFFEKSPEQANDAVQRLLSGASHPRSIDAIVHLGAITDTRESDPENLRKYNLDYSKTLCQVAALNQIPLVYASSAATYGEGTSGYEDREDQMPLLTPLNLYGKSKLDFDLWLLKNEKNPALVPKNWAGFKFFNVYGFGERHKGFMASVVLHAYDQIKKNGEVTLFKSHRQGIADGMQKRDFIYVEDVVKVLHFAIENSLSRGIYNLGTGQARAFRDLAGAVFRALEMPENIRFVDTPIEIRDKYQYFTEAPMKKLRSAGYLEPFTSLEEGVAAYVQRLKKL